MMFKQFSLFRFFLQYGRLPTNIIKHSLEGSLLNTYIADQSKENKKNYTTIDTVMTLVKDHFFSLKEKGLSNEQIKTTLSTTLKLDSLNIKFIYSEKRSNIQKKHFYTDENKKYRIFVNINPNSKKNKFQTTSNFNNYKSLYLGQSLIATPFLKIDNQRFDLQFETKNIEI